GALYVWFVHPLPGQGSPGTLSLHTGPRNFLCDQPELKGVVQRLCFQLRDHGRERSTDLCGAVVDPEERRAGGAPLTSADSWCPINANRPPRRQPVAD